MNDDPVVSFVEKWLTAEPWHRLLLQFERAQRRPLRSLSECIGFELRSAAQDSSDPRVASTKLMWWREEWQRLAAGEPRHPLTLALGRAYSAPIDVQDGMRWIDAAWQLANDVSDADLQARWRRWQDFTQAQAAAFAIDAVDDAGRTHALALLVERLSHWLADLTHGRLPLPLETVAASGLDRTRLAAGDAQSDLTIAAYARMLAAATDASGSTHGSRYRCGQLALARLRAWQIARSPNLARTGVPRLPPIRSALAVWRAFRRP